MSLDLEKLTPAPWEVAKSPEHLISGCTVFGPEGEDIITTDNDGCASDPCPDYINLKEADASFMALARNAFDVMMRRGWAPALPTQETLVDLRTQRWSDPFTALVEADKWYPEKVEKQN